RAAVALFYAPVHFLVTREIVRALRAGDASLTRIMDLGCGTGAAGVAWALECGRDGDRPSIAGVDRNPWAVAEANWMYAQFRLRGRARLGEIAPGPVHESGPDRGLLAS